MSEPNVAVIAGSTRTDSFAKKVARATASRIEAAGGAATFVDLRDFEMPLYDGDLEDAEGLPAGAIALRDVLKQSQAVMFATAEYNASIPAVLKNAIDWVSRPHKADPDVFPWMGKVAGLLSSSPGALGGMRGLVHLRQILMNVGMQVVTEQFAIGAVHEVFDENGMLKSERKEQGIDKVVGSVLRMTKALSNA